MAIKHMFDSGACLYACACARACVCVCVSHWVSAGSGLAAECQPSLQEPASAEKRVKNGQNRQINKQIKK